MKKIKAFLRRKDIIFSAKRYFIDAMGAMAQGLFCTLLVGTILNTLGTQCHIGFLNTVIVTAGKGAKAVNYTMGGLASAMVGPGMMLWAPREYELFRLADGGQEEELLWHYLRRAPVAEAFLWRRWLYLLWDEVDNLVNTGRFDRVRFDLAAKSILPWLA